MEAVLRYSPYIALIVILLAALFAAARGPGGSS